MRTGGGPAPRGSSPTHGAVLGVVGDLLEDIVVWTESELRPATDNRSRIVRTRGGSAANVAALAAGAGTSVRFIGRVGEDALGLHLIEMLTARGVDVRAQREGRTGAVVVLVDSTGERTMFPDRAAAAELSGIQPEWLDSLRMLHATSYSFAEEPGARATLDLIAAATADGIEVSLDASSTALIEELGVARYTEIVATVRPAIFFANADEAALLDLSGPPFATILTIVKGGSNPTIVRSPDGALANVPVAGAARVRDATGAGDAFAAGFLSAHLAGCGVVEAVLAGHALAQGVLGAPGAAIDFDVNPGATR